MALIPPVSIGPTVLPPSVAARNLKCAEQDFQLLTKVTNQEVVPPFIVNIIDGVRTLKINPKFAEYAKILGFRFKL